MSVRSTIAVVAVVAVIGLLTYGLVSKGSSSLAVGDPVPTKALPELEGGGEGSLADYRGKWVLVNFWASWCLPCRDEAPELEAFQREHAGPDFTVVGIDSRDLSSDARAFIEKYDLTYPQLRDGDGAASKEYGTTGVPENFLVNPRGEVVWLFRGPVSEESLRAEIEPRIEGREAS